MSASPDTAVLLFDGECNLCNYAVDFVIRNERRPWLKFAALQSATAKSLLDARLGAAESQALRAPDHGQGPGTVVLVQGEHVWLRSTAILHLAPTLRWPWRLLWLGWLLPRPLRDALYRFVAARRYAWFGKRDTCRIPTADERARFLD